MFYVFVCNGMPFDGNTIPSGKSLGGSETACYYLARELATRGHRVTVFTESKSGGRFDGVDYAPCGELEPRYPLGRNVHGFLENAECDALIVQRATGIFRMPHSAKTAFLWLHDLALIRQTPMVRADAPFYDGLLAVSEWHRQQVHKAWDITLDKIDIIRNAVDQSLYDGVPMRPLASGQLNLFYQSRFERGIDTLIYPGGIMDQLAKSRPEAKLFVCGYENEPDHMKQYYDNVRKRIEQMPNVKILGYMGKKDLAAAQRDMDVMLYPGIFEETSCISAMEAQCAGLPFIGNASGALPETCEDGGAILLDLKDGRCDEAEFVKLLTNITPSRLQGLRERQLRKAESVSWMRSAMTLETLVEYTLGKKHSNLFSLTRSALDRSDVMFAKWAMNGGADFTEAVELQDAYKFAESNEALAQHYDEDHALEALDHDQNLDVTENSRFQFVFEDLMRLGAPSNVLDYGPQKGHYIYSMIKCGLADGVRFTGMDVSKRHVDWANAKFKELGFENVRFVHDDATKWQSANYDGAYTSRTSPTYDALLLCEVLEHVIDPVQLCANLEQTLIDGARVVVSTPYGPWEGKDYNSRPTQKRYHLHHFELNDLHDAFAHHENFSVVGVPAGRSHLGPLGSYVVSFVWRQGKPLMKPVDYMRKLREYVARETVSVCMIVKNAERTILRTLHSVKDVADEFVIAIDRSSTDRTLKIIDEFQGEHCAFKRVHIIDADSPLDVGFDEARNRTVTQARGDWILWIDSDEELLHPERVFKFLRHNLFDGYALAQHHMSGDPPGVLTTDWPVRIFRNVEYLRFRGVVHEHPDDLDNPNCGPRAAAQIAPNDFSIIHHGYTTEEVRRGRFQRNLPLIRRDRKKDPTRVLGAMLWLRDLAHLVMFEMERTGGQLTMAAVEYAKQGMAEWETLLKEADKPINARMLRDGLDYYSTLVSVLGVGFEAQLQFAATKEPGQKPQTPVRIGKFLNRAHFDRYAKAIFDEQLSHFDSKYF